MGLAGMVRQDATLAGSTGRLLFANAAAGFDADVPVVFSEVDVAQHILIDSTLGSLNPASWKAGNNSTLNYAPNFFLVNGSRSTAPPPPTFRSARRPAPAWCCAGQRRPAIAQPDAQQGHGQAADRGRRPLAAPLEHATVLLPAGKTHDALLAATPPATGTDRSLALFDRRGGADGGLIARLAMSADRPDHQPDRGAGGQRGRCLCAADHRQQHQHRLQLHRPADRCGLRLERDRRAELDPVPTGTPVPTSYNITVTGGDGSTSASQSSRCA